MRTKRYFSLLILLLISTSLQCTAIRGWFFDCGHGNAAAIRTPRGRWIIIDTGPPSRGGILPFRDHILPLLWKNGFRRPALTILTHPHSDHIGGARFLFSHLPAAPVWEPGWPHTGDGYPALLRLAGTRQLRWRSPAAGVSTNLDGVALKVLHPHHPLLRGSGSDANNNSLVIHLSYRSFSILFTGDIEQAGLQRLLQHRLPRSTIICAPHHGSATSFSARLYRQTSPAVIVVSCGKHRGGFRSKPDRKLKSMAKKKISTLLRTDRHGTVSFETDGRTVILNWHGGKKTIQLINPP